MLNSRGVSSVGMEEVHYAFIDSQNLNLAMRKQGWILDFKKFRTYLKDKYKIKKAYLFIGHIDGNESLYTSLQEDGFIVVFKPTLVLPDGSVKGNVDTELVLHAMIEFPNYSKAMIISNDGDFHCLVEYLRDKNKLLRLMIPDRYRYSSLLRKFGPFLVYMNDLQKKLRSLKTNKKERH